MNHPLSASSIYYDPQHPPCSIYVLDSLFAQPLFKSSLVYLIGSKSESIYLMGQYANMCELHNKTFP